VSTVVVKIELVL